MKHVTKKISFVSLSAVDNSFLHVFVGITVANAAVIKGKSCLGVVVGPCPFSLLFCCFCDETQVWLGDLRVVLLCGGVLVFVM